MEKAEGRRKKTEGRRKKTEGWRVRGLAKHPHFQPSKKKGSRGERQLFLAEHAENAEL